MQESFVEDAMAFPMFYMINALRSSARNETGEELFSPVLFCEFKDAFQKHIQK
jgi:hypothetical protein